MRKATRFLKSPDIDKIPLPTSRIRQIFYKRINPISDFGELKTPHKEDDLNSYHQLIERFDFPADIQQTWSHFINRKPSEIWSGPYNSFLFAHSKITQDFYYLHDPRAVSLHEGMQLFTLFRLFIPLTIIAMEIIEINPEARSATFAYIEGGMFRGIQKLEFVEQIGGSTRIIHSSFYRAEKPVFRLIPYQFFHKKLIAVFHQGMKDKYLATKNTSI